MNILTIVGARPQFIKAAVVSAALRKAQVPEHILHTGQHYDASMSEVFFRELGLPVPAHNLGIANLAHGAMTGRMLEAIESILVAGRPNLVLVYGDTNSTLAGALAAVKLGIPIAHVEAGMRSFNRAMPEEINRVVTDHTANLHFAVGEQAKSWLKDEGVVNGVHVTGDVMLDAALNFRNTAQQLGTRARMNLGPVPYALVTFHRAENTSSRDSLAGIVEGLERIAPWIKVIVLLHPRTRRALDEFGLKFRHEAIQVWEPVGYLEMLDLEGGAALVVTDSGGVQKEAFYAGIPCVTLREETEWLETLHGGWNRLAGCDPDRIAPQVRSALGIKSIGHPPSEVFGDGHAADRIAGIVATSLNV